MLWLPIRPTIEHKITHARSSKSNPRAVGILGSCISIAVIAETIGIRGAADPIAPGSEGGAVLIWWDIGEENFVTDP